MIFSNTMLKRVTNTFLVCVVMSYVGCAHKLLNLIECRSRPAVMCAMRLVEQYGVHSIRLVLFLP
jgi:hypothetical protein